MTRAVGTTAQEQSAVLVRGPVDGVLELELNRPARRNALSTAMLRELVARFDAASGDVNVRCVVLTGGDDVFAAGSDVEELARNDLQATLVDERPGLFAAIARFPKPCIAAVCGYALGGGCELAMLADIVVAGASAQFGQPEINLGMIPGAGGTQRLVRTVGKPLAMKMILGGEFIDAPTALAAGLVAEVVPDGECIARARAIAHKIAGKAPLAVLMAKDAILQAFEMPLSAALAAERRNFVILAGTEDRAEGVRAFLDKRKPSWKGR